MMNSVARSAMVLMSILGSSTIFSQSKPPGDPMTVYYGNTLSCRTATMQCHIWFNQDGTYRQFQTVAAADKSFQVTGFIGQYKVSLRDGADETCLTGRGGGLGRRPVEECYTLAGHKPGDAWDAKTSDGTAIHFSLQSGHHVNAGSSFL